MADDRRAAPTPASVHDELVSHVEGALKRLRAKKVTDEGIHAARKHLKRARANLRLLRDSIGKSAYAHENAALRDAARPLSAVRDAKVLVETADALIQAVATGPRRTLLLNTRRALEKARRAARAELRVMNAATAGGAALVAALERMRKWRIDAAEPQLLAEALERIYRKAREAFDAARGEPTPDNLHEWRKQVKYLEQSMRVWDSSDGDVAQLRKRAEALADTLGTDHDLVVFEERLLDLDAPASARPDVSRAIHSKRRKLRDEALKHGRDLFQGSTRKVLRKTAARD